jgi:hypothetical protein
MISYLLKSGSGLFAVPFPLFPPGTMPAVILTAIPSFQMMLFRKNDIAFRSQIKFILFKPIVKGHAQISTFSFSVGSERPLKKEVVRCAFI